MYLELKRISDNGVQTIGEMRLCDAAGHTLLRFDTLELAYLNNERQKSCIKTGVYVVQRKTSFRHGQCFALLNILGRDNILIHSGNFNRDTKGCILIGNGLKDIDGDFEIDVMNSKISMKNLLRTLKTTTTIYIWNEWEQIEVI